MDARDHSLSVRLAWLGIVTSFLSACAGGNAMKAQYSRSSVEPVQATQRPDGQLALRYRILPESQFYSKGVDFREHDGTLQVFIKRCGIDEACAPMAPNVLPADDSWQAEVHLPYRGGTVVVVHADGEQQVYP
jgi:hypothetical protein